MDKSEEIRALDMFSVLNNKYLDKIERIRKI